MSKPIIENTNLLALDVIESAGLEPDATRLLKERFSPFLEQAEGWKEKAEGLVVTDESQTREMAMARHARLALRQIRIDADKTRKVLKEDAIKYGRAVQGVYNVIEKTIKPIEEHLMEQEKFAEIQERKRREELNAKRERIAAPLMDWITEDLPFNNTPWAHFSDDRFNAIIAEAKAEKKAYEEEQARLEAERIAREKAEAEERERLRAENERLQAERAEMERKQAEERRKLEEQARKEREEAEKKLAEERAERERLEAEARQREAEEQAKWEAEEAERRKAAAAPDKEKLLAFAAELSAIALPSVTVKQASMIAQEAAEVLANLAAWIREETESKL